MNPALEVLRQGAEWAQAYGAQTLTYLVPAYFALGWVTPVFHRHRINTVIESRNNLVARISLEKQNGRKPMINDKINLAILNFTRGAFLHAHIHNSRQNSSIAKIKKELNK